jgi:hypothetical protein
MGLWNWDIEEWGEICVSLYVVIDGVEQRILPVVKYDTMPRYMKLKKEILERGDMNCLSSVAYSGDSLTSKNAVYAL